MLITHSSGSTFARFDQEIKVDIWENVFLIIDITFKTARRN